jgi:hypothetical protein
MKVDTMRRFRFLIALVVAGCANPGPSLQSLRLGTVSECGSPIGEIGVVDIAIVIDASSSTRMPSHADIDGDGEIGRFERSEVTDPSDSILAAQVAAVRSLVRATTPHGARLSLVSYSGPTDYEDSRAGAAVVRSAVATSPAQLDQGLELVLERGSRGTSDFSAGMRRALQTLAEAPPHSQATRRVIFFLSDSADPILPQPYPLVPFPKRDSQMKTAAIRAIEAGVRIHTFALGNAVGAQAPNALTRIAGATGGVHHAVERADRLHCDLLAALDAGSAEVP